MNPPRFGPDSEPALVGSPAEPLAAEGTVTERPAPAPERPAPPPPPPVVGAGDPPRQPPLAPPSPWYGSINWSVVRWFAFAVYVLIFFYQADEKGLPIGRDRVMMWMAAALLISCIGRTWNMALLVFVDWVPFCLVLLLYDLSRGWADNDGLHVHYTPQIDVDRFLFFGHDPTIFVQRWFYGGLHAGDAPWWRLLFDATYLSHYLVPFVFAGILWTRNRHTFLQWSRRFVTLSFVGFATYALFPAAPPWMAARDGYLPGVHREGTVLLPKIHLGVLRDVFDANEAKFNQVAAVPSLHAAFTVLLVAFLWRRTPRIARPLLLLYPITMTLTLVSRGEHYVADVLLGAFYAVAVHIAFNYIDPWWDGKVKGAFYTCGYYTPLPPEWRHAPTDEAPSAYAPIVVTTPPQWPAGTGPVVTAPEPRPPEPRPPEPRPPGDDPAGRPGP